MKLHIIDLSIIAIYLVLTVAIGFRISRKASENLDSYFLGGKTILWLWPVFNQVFLMVYMAAWMRRSNVLTGVEWMTTRFGCGKGAKLAHISVVIFALVSVVGFLTYAFEGIGKFSAQFLPRRLSPDMYALIFMAITSLYIIKGGMYSVVFTEVLQFVITTVGSNYSGHHRHGQSLARSIAKSDPQRLDGCTLRLETGPGLVRPHRCGE